MRQKSETIFFSIIVRLTFFVTGLHPSRKHTFSIVSFHDNLPLFPIDRTPDIIKIKTPPQPVVYPVPRVRDIYSNSRGYTDNFLLDISVHVKDQVNIVTGQDREKEKREKEREMSVEIRDHKSHISRAESRKSSWIFLASIYRFESIDRAWSIAFFTCHRAKLCTCGRC